MISLGLAVDPERARRADELVENAFNDFLADREREWQEVRVERPERVPPMAKPEDEPIGWTATDRKQAEERLEKYHQKVNAATKETTRRIVARGRALRRPGTNHDLGFDFYFNRDAIAEVFVKVGPAFFESPRAASWLARLSRAAKEPEPKTVEALRPLVLDGRHYLETASDNPDEARKAADARRALELLLHAVTGSTKPTRAADRDTPGTKKGYVNWDEIRDAVPKWRRLGRGEKADFVLAFAKRSGLSPSTVEKSLRKAREVMDSPTVIEKTKPE